MAKNRTIVKSCPKCELQVAVASKSCKCGYSFFNARRGVQTSKSESDERRRTSRVRREKPNYYDSQEFDRKKNKRNKGKGKKSLCEEQQLAEEKLVSKETTAARAKRRRQRKEEEDGGGDLCAKLPQEKQDIAAIILSEINRKLCGVVWKA